MQSNNRTRALVECALMIALAAVLSKIEIPLWLQGGSITLASMLPILLVSYRHGLKWGLLTSFTFSLVQMGLGFHNVLYCRTLGAQITCVLLDYVVAFTVLGLAAGIGRGIKNSALRMAAGCGAVIFVRFLCSFASGIVLWGEYAPEGAPVWLYSLGYNGGYMLPELIITVGAAMLLSRASSIIPKTAEATGS